MSGPTLAGTWSAVADVPDVYDNEISLRPLLRTLWSYRQVISLAVAGVIGIFAVAMLPAYVSQAVERLGTVEFRLLFQGASQGQYPNGTPFSSAEITSIPVLTEVFETNDLERYGSYDDFKKLGLRAAVEPRARAPVL